MYFIYGAGGTGKTSLAKLFPGQKILLSFDLSTNPLRGTKGMDIAIVESADAPQIQAIVEKWVGKATKSDKYDVIVLDNITALQNLVLENIDGKSKDGRQNYQKMQLWFRQLGTVLRESGKTVYATAHEIDNGVNGMDNKGHYQADMNKGTFNAFTSMFDLVGHIYLAQGARLIDLDPEQGNLAKNRLDNRKLINADELLQEESKGENK